MGASSPAAPFSCFLCGRQLTATQGTLAGALSQGTLRQTVQGTVSTTFSITHSIVGSSQVISVFTRILRGYGPLHFGQAPPHSLPQSSCPPRKTFPPPLRRQKGFSLVA